MLKFILNCCCFYTYKLRGWRFENKATQHLKKYVLIAAPHTSNWDMYFAATSFYMMKVPVRFAIKSEWVKFPFKSLMLGLGAIGVDRNAKGDKKISFVDAVVDLFNKNEELIICITPEGTRSRNPKWKSGFYHIALKANLPIAVGYCDYKNKITCIEKLVYPTGNMKEDLKQIAALYNANMAKYPENFVLDIDLTASSK